MVGTSTDDLHHNDTNEVSHSFTVPTQFNMCVTFVSILIVTLEESQNTQYTTAEGRKQV